MSISLLYFGRQSKQNINKKGYSWVKTFLSLGNCVKIITQDSQIIRVLVC